MATLLEPYAPSAATAYREAARQLDEPLAGHAAALLTLEQAARESGYSARHLARLAREGRLPLLSDGRVRRSDLPRKPSRRPPSAQETRDPASSFKEAARRAHILIPQGKSLKRYVTEKLFERVDLIQTLQQEAKNDAKA